MKVGLNLYQDAVHAKLHDTRIERLKLLLNCSGVVAGLLQVLRAHDGEQIIIRLAINIVLAAAQLRHARLDVSLKLLAVGHREEQAIQGRLRLTLVHGLRHLRTRQILLGNIASRTNAIGLLGLLVALDFANIGNATCIFGRVLDGGLREKVRKGLHAYPKSRLKHGLSTNASGIGGHNIQLKGLHGLLGGVQDG